MQAIITGFLCGLASYQLLFSLVSDNVESNTTKYCEHTYTDTAEVKFCKQDLENITSSAYKIGG